MAMLNVGDKPAGDVEHIERMARRPFVLSGTGADDSSILVAVPEGFALQDHSELLPLPPRHRGTVTVNQVDCFIALLARHATDDSCVYVDADYMGGWVAATVIFNENGSTTPGWRDHRAVFEPRFTPEWLRWTRRSGEHMGQAEFGFFLEQNLIDIADPAGAAVLEFVTELTEHRKVRYGSAVNLANGMVALEFVEEGDAATKGRVEMFKKFVVGLRPFAGGEAYSVDALLRYRIERNTGEIRFWFDLQRVERVLEDACREMVDHIREAGVFVVFGCP